VPGSEGLPEIFRLFNQQQHGNGCNCPYCRAAAAAIEKNQQTVAGLSQMAVAHTPRPVATSTLTVGLRGELAKDGLLPVFASLWQAPTAVPTAAPVAPMAAPADAFFADRAWLNELGFGL
jgi:hypothetical protein